MPVDNEPSSPYHAGPGTAHEIGVMMGFIVAFVLSMGLYLIFWKGKLFCISELDVYSTI